jgi:hypothetical protein
MDEIIKLLYIYGFDTSNKISVYTLKQHVVHNIHRLAWGHYGRGALLNCPVCPCVKTSLDLINGTAMCYKQLLVLSFPWS